MHCKFHLWHQSFAFFHCLVREQRLMGELMMQSTNNLTKQQDPSVFHESQHAQIKTQTQIETQTATVTIRSVRTAFKSKHILPQSQYASLFSALKSKYILPQSHIFPPDICNQKNTKNVQHHYCSPYPSTYFHFKQHAKTQTKSPSLSA